MNPSTEPHRTRPRHEAFVVIGDELAAGAGPFGLSSDRQKWSFPAQAASRLGLPFRLPKLAGEGIGTPVGSIPGGPSPGISLLAPPTDPAAGPAPPNLVALPGIGFHEAVHRRITQPLVGHEPNQDLFNLSLGLPALLSGRRALTPVEMAASLQPDSALLCLGYHEACRAAVALDPTLLPPVALVQESLEQACATLGPCRRLLSTVPDPLHSTFFLSRSTVGRWWQIEPEDLGRLLDWHPSHLLPASALESIGARLGRDRPESQSSDPPITFLTPTLAAELRAGLAAINDVIQNVAERDGAQLLDLAALFQRLAEDGLSVEGRRLSAEPGGGFFAMTSFLPGPVGHGVIADMLVEQLRAGLDTGDRLGKDPAWETLFELDKALGLEMIDTTTPAEQEPHASHQLSSHFSSPKPDPTHEPSPTERSDRTDGSEPAVSADPTDPVDLLPGQELIFELGPDGGCLDRALTAEDPTLMLGGPAISRCGARGRLLLRLLKIGNDPESNDGPQVEGMHPPLLWAPFELAFDPELEVEPGPLSAPHAWRSDLPAGRWRATWTGRLHRHSLQIRELQLEVEQECSFRNRLSALCPEPANDQLDTRLEVSRDPEGRLQLSLGVTWITEWGQLESGPGARIPWLPETSPPSTAGAGPAVCLSCRRVTLSQRLSLQGSESPATFAAEAEDRGQNPGEDHWPLTPRSFLELTSFSHDSRLSAHASVDAPPARANVEWAHPLLGRWVLQSGEPSGDRLPVLIHPLPFEAQNGPRGWLGFESEVRFGEQIYPQPAIRLSPPTRSFNICSVDRLNGASIGPFELTLQDDRRLLRDLHKLQALSGSLTMAYRGSARLETQSGGDVHFFFDPPLNRDDSFLGASEENTGLHLRPSSLFPAPHGTSGYPVRTHSRFDFNLRLAAGRGLQAPSGKLSGEERLLSSTRRLFSYRYMLSTRATDPATFELIDHTLGGTFVLKHLVHIVFGSSPSSRARRTPDTVTFSGFGTWSLDPESGPTHRISAHLCRSRHSPFIAIAIDEGSTSSISTDFCS